MKQKDYELKSIKIKDGKVNTLYDETRVVGEVTYGKNFDVTDKLIPHPDLNDALNALAPHVATACDLSIKLPKKLKLPKDIQTAIDKENDRIASSINVTGVSLQGDEENRSLVITATREIRGQNGEKHTSQALNSPKISTNGDVFGCESTIAKLIKTIIKESFEYAVNGKAQNPELGLKVA